MRAYSKIIEDHTRPAPAICQTLKRSSGIAVSAAVKLKTLFKTYNLDFLLKQEGNKVLTSTYLPGKSILYFVFDHVSTHRKSELGFEQGLALRKLQLRYLTTSSTNGVAPWFLEKHGWTFHMPNIPSARWRTRESKKRIHTPWFLEFFYLLPRPLFHSAPQ